MVRAVAPTDLVSKALDSDDFGIDKSRALYRKQNQQRSRWLMFKIRFQYV